MTPGVDNFPLSYLLKPYRLRTFIRSRSPCFLIKLGWMAQGADCEARSEKHVWRNIDDVLSGCLHCKIEREGQLWRTGL